RRETVTPDLPGVRVIKRYGNRRLYDHTLSKAVTMDDLAAAVRKGEDFRVFDGDKGDDVTRRVLLQIMLEEQNETQLHFVPIEFRRLLIKMRSEPVGQWMSQYLDAGAEWMTRHLSQSAAGAGARLQDSMEAIFPWLKREAGGEPATPGPAAAGGEKKSSDL